MAATMASQQGNSLSPRNMLYSKISDSFNKEEERSLHALLVGEKIPKGKLQKKTPHEIFNMLEEDHKIGEGNLGLLVVLLKSLGKTELAKEAEDLEKIERMAMPSTSKRKAPEEASSTKQPKMSHDDDEDSDDSASSAESGIGCSASASPQQDTDMPDYESGRNLMTSAEGAAGGSTFETVGDVRKRINQLRTEIAKLTRDPNNISETKTEKLSKACQELVSLDQHLNKQSKGELNMGLTLHAIEEQEEFRVRYESGTLRQKIGMKAKHIILSASDDIVDVEPGVSVEFNSNTGQCATIKITAANVELADSYNKLDEESAVRQLFKYLVDNRKELRPITRYLNSFDVQVAKISYGSIDFVCLCLTPESAVRLQQDYDSKKLQAQVQRVISSLSAILTEFGIKSISLAVDLKFADEVSKASGGTLQSNIYGSSDCGQDDLKDPTEACSPGTDHTSTMEHQDDTNMSGLHSECQGGVEVKDLVEFGQFPSEEATGIKMSATHNKNHQEDGMTADATDELDEKEVRTELKGSYREATAGQKGSLTLQPQRTIDGRLKLDLRDKGLTSIPEEVFDITDLEILDVSNNKLTSIPEAIGRLQKLERLDADGNKLTSLPQAIGSLQKLTHLYIQGNQLTGVPPGVCSLSNIEALDVSRNPIRSLPDDVRRLTRLKSLRVSNCKFEEFPRQVLQLKTLERLYAGECKFDTVPDEVETLQHLWFLSFEHNLLRTLPSTMSHLHNLRVVHLWNNKFDTLPEVLCELPAMEKLDIRNNNITRLPTALHRADKLEDLDVSGNPLTYPPQDVCKRGTGPIMAFLAEKDQVQEARLSAKVDQDLVDLNARNRSKAAENLREILALHNSKRAHLSELCHRITESYLRKVDKGTKDILKTQFGRSAQDIVTDVQTQLHREECPILVAGEPSSEKSTFLNLLLGEDILPVAHLSSTSVIREVKYGETRQAVVHLREPNDEGERQITIPLDGTKERQQQLDSNIHLKGASREKLPPAVRVEIFWPHPLLKGGIVLVDSPGVGESEMMDRVVADYIPKCKNILYIIDSSRAGGVQQDRLRRLLQLYARKVNFEDFHPESFMFICNKWDLVPPEERDKVKTETLRKLSLMWPCLEKVFYVSSKKAVRPGGILSKDFSKVLKGLNSLLPKSLDIKLETQYRLLTRLSTEALTHINRQLTVARQHLDEAGKLRKCHEAKQHLQLFQGSYDQSKEELNREFRNNAETIKNFLSNLVKEEVMEVQKLLVSLPDDFLPLRGQDIQGILRGQDTLVKLVKRGDQDFSRLKSLYGGLANNLADCSGSFKEFITSREKSFRHKLEEVAKSLEKAQQQAMSAITGSPCPVSRMEVRDFLSQYNMFCSGLTMAHMLRPGTLNLARAFMNKWEPPSSTSDILENFFRGALADTPLVDILMEALSSSDELLTDLAERQMQPQRDLMALLEADITKMRTIMEQTIDQTLKDTRSNEEILQTYESQSRDISNFLNQLAMFHLTEMRP